MRFPPRITRTGATGAVLSALLVGGTVATASPAAAAIGSICYSALPSQAHSTLDLIEQGGPYPYSQDGTVFPKRGHGRRPELLHEARETCHLTQPPRREQATCLL